MGEQAGFSEYKDRLGELSPDEVRLIQSSLNRTTGAKLMEDGIAGDKTKAALQNAINLEKGVTPPAVTPSTPATTTMTGGIHNTALNSKEATSTTSVDTSGVNDSYAAMLQNMRDNGLTLSQAYNAANPAPAYDDKEERRLKTNYKAALIADALRLIVDGVGASKGAQVQKRDGQSVYNNINNQNFTIQDFLGEINNQLLNEYKTHAATVAAWKKGRTDAALADAKSAQEMYKIAYQNAPKVTKTQTTEQNGWDRVKHQEEIAQKEKDRKSREDIAAKNRANARDIAAAKDNGEKYTGFVIDMPTRTANGQIVTGRHQYEVPKQYEKSYVGKIYGEMVAKYKGIIDKPEAQRTPQEKRIAEDIAFIKNVYSNPSGTDVLSAVQTKLQSYPDIAHRNLKQHLKQLTGTNGEDIGRPASPWGTAPTQTGSKSRVPGSKSRVKR